MKYASWPKPPIHKHSNPPPIPSEFILFGLKYRVINGNPTLEMPSNPLDKQHIKECVDQSISLFLKTLKTREGNILNEIRDLHVHINEEINKAKAFEKNEMIVLAKNRKIAIKNQILKEIANLAIQ